MNENDCERVPIYAVILELNSPSGKGICLFELIKKLFRLTNSSFPIDGQLILPKIILISELATQEVPSWGQNCEGIEHLILKPIDKQSWK